MNKERFAAFSMAYHAGLRAAVEALPDDYLLARDETAESYAQRVASKMLASIGGGRHFGVNYDSNGFKRACKALGIKHTRKAILAYLEIPNA